MKAIGRNITLSFFLVFELLFCAYSLIETWDSDNNPREFEYVSAQITKIHEGDPIYEMIGFEEMDRYHYYLVKVTIKNRYTEELRQLIMHAENEDGDDMICLTADYYDRANDTYLLSEEIPPGTEGFFDYIVCVGDYCYEETEKLRLFEHNNEKVYIEAALPKE